MPAGADLGEDSCRRFARCAPAGGFAAVSDRAGVPVAGVDCGIVPLGDSSVVVAAGASPAVGCAGVTEGAGVVASGADLDVAVGRGGWEAGVALGVGDAQGGEGDGREEVSTPPPPAGGRARTARAGGWLRSGRRSCVARLTLYTSAGSGVVTHLNPPPCAEAAFPESSPTHEAPLGRAPYAGGRRF